MDSIVNCYNKHGQKNVVGVRCRKWCVPARMCLYTPLKSERDTRSKLSPNKSRRRRRQVRKRRRPRPWGNSLPSNILTQQRPQHRLAPQQHPHTAASAAPSGSPATSSQSSVRSTVPNNILTQQRPQHRLAAPWSSFSVYRQTPRNLRPSGRVGCPCDVTTGQTVEHNWFFCKSNFSM